MDEGLPFLFALTSNVHDQLNLNEKEEGERRKKKKYLKDRNQSSNQSRDPTYRVLACESTSMDILL